MALDVGVAAGVTSGTVIALQVQNEVYSDASANAVAGTGSTDGSVTVAGLTVTPNPHDFATQLAGGGPYSQAFTVTNSGVAGGIILGTPYAAFTTGTDLTIAAGATCVDGGALADAASCTFTVEWNPAAAGTLSDTVTVASDANNVAVPLSGTAVANDAQLNVTSGTINSTQSVGGGVVNIGTFTIANSATSPVTENLTFTNCALTGAAEITYTGTLATLDALSIAPGASGNTGQFACNTAVAGTFNSTLNCDTSDNDNAAGAAIGTISCTVTAAQLDATPAPSTTIALGQVQLGSSASSGIDLGNSAGSSDLTITSIALTTGTDITLTTIPTLPLTIPAGTIQDGTDDIVVQCAPSADGAISDTITVVSNDGASPHTWDVSCEGVSTAVPSITPAAGGTVNVGPNVGTTTATINVSNTGNDSFSIDTCTLDATLTAAPYNCTVTAPATFPATVAAGGNQSITVECTLAQGDAATVANGLSCDFTGDFDGDNATAPTTTTNAWTMNLVGAVFVIPALNSFGLLLLALTLLVAGAVVVRRHA